MKTIIGIGTAGSNVVKQLAEYKQYRHYTISTDNPKTSKYNFKFLILEYLCG